FRSESSDTLFSGFPRYKLNVTSFTSVPFINHYRSKATLDIDRMAWATTATVLYPHDVPIIDTGICITYDIITAPKKDIGSSISPGLNMRYRSPNNFTANLPLLRA